MTVLKVDFNRGEIQKDPKSFNDFCWTGLTLGKLMALRGALEVVEAHRRIAGEGPGAVSHDCLVILDRAINAAEQQEAQAQAQAQAQAR